MKLRRRLRRGRGMLRAWLWGRGHQEITVGRGVVIGRWCRLIVEPGAQLVIGDRCEIDDGTTVAVYGAGVLELGASSFVGHHCTLAARESVRIGRRTYLAELVSVRDHEHDPDLPPSSGATRVAPVVIADDVWLASKVSVLRGSTIGERAVVGAHAVVRGDLAAFTLAAGIPARVVRQIGDRADTAEVNA